MKGISVSLAPMDSSPLTNIREFITDLMVATAKYLVNYFVITNEQSAILCSLF